MRPAMLHYLFAAVAALNAAHGHAAQSTVSKSAQLRAPTSAVAAYLTANRSSLIASGGAANGAVVVHNADGTLTVTKQTERQGNVTLTLRETNRRNYFRLDLVDAHGAPVTAYTLVAVLQDNQQGCKFTLYTTISIQPKQRAAEKRVQGKMDETIQQSTARILGLLVAKFGGQLL